MVTAQQAWGTAWLVVGVLCLFPAFVPLASLPLLSEWLPALSHHVMPEKARYSPIGYWFLLTLVWQLQRRWPVASSPFFSVAFR